MLSFLKGCLSNFVETMCIKQFKCAKILTYHKRLSDNFCGEYIFSKNCNIYLFDNEKIKQFECTKSLIYHKNCQTTP